jgi:hypothetical protein
MSAYTAMAIRLAAFSGAVAVACWVTKSGLPLFAFLLYPTISSDDKDG